MALFGLLGGGDGSADDPYADILTPAQRNQMQVQGLLAMAGAFAEAGMPSRLPIPFGAALGKAAAALGAGTEAGMKSALENAQVAQKVRDLRSVAEFRKQFFGDQDAIYKRIDDALRPGAAPTRQTSPPPLGTYVGPGSGGAPAGGGGLLSPDFALGSDYASGVTAPKPGGTGRFAGGLLDYPAPTDGLSVGGGGLLSAPAEPDVGLTTPSSRYQPGGDLYPFKQLGILPPGAGGGASAPTPGGTAVSPRQTSGYLQVADENGAGVGSSRSPAQAGGYQFYGDSIAHGTREAAGAGGVTRGGWRPDQVLGSLEGANPQGDTVVISSGITNSTAQGLPVDQWRRDIALVPQQIAAARQSGAGNVALYGVGGGVRDHDQINAELRRIAGENGASFVPLVGTGGGWHPKDYNAQFDYTRTQLGVGSGAMPTPVPSVTSVPGGTNGIVPRGFSGSSGVSAEPDPGAGGDGDIAPSGGGLLGTASDYRAPIEANPFARNPSPGDPRGVAPLIRLAMLRQGVDPDVALRVARSEGLAKFSGDAGKSGGAFQLYTGGGLGNEFQKQTGLDPLDPKNEAATIDWVARNVNRTGWGPYHGAATVGIGPRTGLPGGPPGGPPDEVIPSGSGARPPIMQAQYQPGVGAPGGAASPQIPQIPQVPAPPGVNPAKFNGLLLELARRNAAAEVLGMGNPYGSLLTVLQGSPQYRAAIEGATETARRGAGLPFVGPEEAAKAGARYPFEIGRDTNKAILDQINKEAEQRGAAALKPAEIIVKDPQGGVMKIQGTEYQKALIANGFSVPELNVVGMYGPPTSTPNIPGLSPPGTPTTRTPAAPGGAAGLTPAGEPVYTPGQITAQQAAATDAQKLVQTYRETADAAVGAKTTLQNISGEIGSMVHGPFAPGAQLAASYLRILDPGFNKQVQSYEELYANANELVRKAVRQSDPNPSFIQTQMAFNAMPVPEKSPLGLQQITNRMIGVNDHDIARAAAIDTYKTNNAGDPAGFDSWWRKSVSPYAFVFNRMTPDDQRSLVTRLNETNQGKREIAKLKDQLGFIKQYGLEQ